MNSIRILLADDHPLFLDGLHGLLDSIPDTEVVGEATNGEEVISLAAALQPEPATSTSTSPPSAFAAVRALAVASLIVAPSCSARSNVAI